MAVKVKMSNGDTVDVTGMALADFKNLWQGALSRNELIDLDGKVLVHPGHIVAVK